MSMWLKLSVAVLLTSVYVLAGKAGQEFALINSYASAVWAPTGIAIAALLVFGYRMWPAIFIGALIVNVTLSQSIPVSLAIAVGNTLEAALAAFMVNRLANGRHAFDHARDVYRFAVSAGFSAPTISATVGVTTLVVSGLMPSDQYVESWLTWWLGNAAGALIVAPLLILWADRRVRYDRRRWLEGSLWVASLSMFCLLLIVPPLSIQYYPLGFLALPIIVWSAFRFGQREAVTAAVLLSGFTIWRTSQGVGLFSGYADHESLVLLQLFMTFISLSGLALAAVVAERRRSEESRRWLATIVESSNDAIIGNNLDGIVLSWNRAAERIYGYSSHEAVGRPISFLVPPDRFDEVPQILQRIRQGERVEHYATKHSRKDRTRISVSLTVSPIRDEAGGIIGASIIARDISNWERSVSLPQDGETVEIS
jgi:PAS domain S-box-containing protein